jgi:hypothetical protein
MIRSAASIGSCSCVSIFGSLSNGAVRASCKTDQSLLRAVARAHCWFDDLVSGRCGSMVEIAKCNGVGKQYVSRLIRLAFLAPEEARAIVDPVLRLMMAAVHRYGGQFAQSTGDGIFALFGAPVAYEDDPQRALHAALAMQEGLRRGADRLRNEGQDFRRGANRGEHERGGGADGRDRRQYGIHAGQSRDQLAARVQTAAPAHARSDQADYITRVGPRCLSPGEERVFGRSRSRSLY